MSGAPEWFDFIAERVGTRKWVLAKRLTQAMREKGYEAALSHDRYETLNREWETLRYGAPLQALEKAAPDLLAALRGLVAIAANPGDGGVFEVGELPELDAARAAIAKATRA